MAGRVAVPASGSQGITLNFRSVAGQADTLVGLVVSLFRHSTPQAGGALIGTANPGDAITVFLTPCTPNQAFVYPLTIPPTTSTLGFPFYYQSAWLNAVSGAITTARVTELPLFN